MTKKRPALGVTFALFGALLFGLNASTSKVVMLHGLSGAQIVLFRSFATALLAGLFLLFTNRAAFKVKLKDWPLLILFGVIGVAVMQWAYSMAVSKLQVGVALLVEYTAIIWVPLVAMALFKKRVRPRIWVGVALVVAGLIVVSNLNISTLNAEGLGFAFLAAATLTLYFIAGERIQFRRDALSTLFYSMSISTVFWLVMNKGTYLGDFDALAHTSLTGNLAALEPPLWFLLLWLAVAGSFLPMLFSYLALRHLSATGVGITSTAETIFAFAFGYYWLGETISVTQLVGSAIVLSGILIAQTAGKN